MNERLWNLDIFNKALIQGNQHNFNESILEKKNIEHKFKHRELKRNSREANSRNVNKTRIKHKKEETKINEETYLWRPLTRNLSSEYHMMTGFLLKLVGIMFKLVEIGQNFRWCLQTSIQRKGSNNTQRNRRVTLLQGVLVENSHTLTGSKTLGGEILN